MDRKILNLIRDDVTRRRCASFRIVSAERTSALYSRVLLSCNVWASPAGEMSDFGGSVHRIAGSSGNEVGGLIKKKPSSQEAGGGGGRDGGGEKSSKWDKKPSEFKVPAPRTSLFGLDVLAKRKREEREAKEATKFGEKRIKMTQGAGISSISQSESHFSEDGARVSFGRSSEKQRDRMYREARVETPSHTGGVNEEALDRIQQRLRRERPFAVGAKSRDSDRGHK